MVTTGSTTEVLQSGLLKEPIENLKKRLKGYYYKRITVKGGEMRWVRTELLPYDVQSKAYYCSKGFRTDPPQGTEWAKPEVKVEDGNDALYAEIAMLRAKLKSQEEVQAQLDAVKKQMTELTTLKGKKGRPKKEVK